MKKLYTHKAMQKRKRTEAKKATFSGSIIPALKDHEVDLGALDLTTYELILFEILEDILAFSVGYPADDILSSALRGDYQFSKDIIDELRSVDSHRAKLERIVKTADSLYKRKQHDTLSELLSDFIEYIVNHFDEAEHSDVKGQRDRIVTGALINDFTLVKEMITEVMQQRPGFIRKYLDWLSTVVIDTTRVKKQQSELGLGVGLSLFKQHKQGLKQVQGAMRPSALKVSDRVELQGSSES